MDGRGRSAFTLTKRTYHVLEMIVQKKRLRSANAQTKLSAGGPGNYHVVKCGSSGHNIRSRPNMKGTPVGMLVLGNQVTVGEEVREKIDTESKCSANATPSFAFLGGARL